VAIWRGSAPSRPARARSRSGSAGLGAAADAAKNRG